MDRVGTLVAGALVLSCVSVATSAAAQPAAPPEPAPPPAAAPAPAEKPIAGYDKGFFLRTEDEDFLLKINGRVKFRFETEVFDDLREDEDGNPLENEFHFSVPRVRVSFGGHAFTDDLTYKLQFAWDNGEAILKDAYF